MEFSQTPRILTFLELIELKKSSLVNMLVRFYGKLDCRFFTATMSFLYLNFSKTAKVP